MAHWERLRSTNGLERLHGEVKRRIRSVGAFPDRASALRLITAVALEVTGIWDDRRYLDMALLKSNSDTTEQYHQGAFLPRTPSEPTTHDSGLDPTILPLTTTTSNPTIPRS